MHAIFQSLPGLIEEFADDDARAAIVAAIWPNVIGEHLREQSAVIGLSEGALAIAVSSLEWKREFNEHAAEILYKLNRSIGASLVRRLELKVERKLVENARSRAVPESRSTSGAIAPAELRKSAAAIADPELRTNFLGAAAACIERRDAK